MDSHSKCWLCALLAVAVLGTSRVAVAGPPASPAAVDVKADLGGEEPESIGTMTVDDHADDAGNFITATFMLDADHAYLDEWYNFRWINVETSFSIDGEAQESDPHPASAPLGTLPAIDPAPGPIDGGNDYNDAAPFYFTDDEFDDLHTPGSAVPWSDSRGGSAGEVITFATYLVAQSITDSSISSGTLCVLAGFEWTSTGAGGPNPPGNSETLDSTIPSPGAADAQRINEAIGNANEPGFAGWSATTSCTFSECPKVTDCVYSSSPGTHFSESSWTRDGDEIGKTFEGGVTPVPGVPQYDTTYLPTEPNDWHWSVDFTWNQIPVTLQVWIENFAPGDEIEVEVICSEQYLGIDLMLMIDVGNDTYSLQQPKGAEVFEGQWSQYPLDLPPSLGFIPTGDKRQNFPAPPDPCPWDFNGDGIVNAADLAQLLGGWGPNPGHPADFNGDGLVNAADLAQLLGHWGPCPLQNDCNMNGMDDAIDLLLGNSQDVDGDGIPDECQTKISQLDYMNGDDVFLPFGQNSHVGVVDFAYLAAPDVMWGQVVVDGVWVVKNLPLYNINGVGVEHTHSTQFYLGNSPGQNVTSAQVYSQITLSQMDDLGPPPSGAPITKAVGDEVRRQGGSNLNGESDWNPDLLAIPDNFTLSLFGLTWEFTARPNMPNLNVKWNHCSPGGAANSFYCLKKRLCIPLNQTLQQIYDKLRDGNHMMTTKANGTWLNNPDNKIVTGIQAFVTNKGLSDYVTVLSNGPLFDGNAFDPNKVHEWMQQGYDVVLEYGYTSGGGHTVVVAGTVKCGSNLYFIVRSDHDQHLKTFQTPSSPGKKNGGVSKWDVHCVKSAGGGLYKLTNESDNRIRGAVALCPTQPMAWDFVSSSDAVAWGPGLWTKYGQVIGETFPGGISTGGTGASAASDHVNLPVWPNDWHWDAVYECSGFDSILQVWFENFLATDQLSLEIYCNPTYPNYMIQVDVTNDVYTLTDGAMVPFHTDLWSEYPGNLPPGFGATGSVRGNVECISDAECDDGDPCTTDACESGMCLHVPEPFCCGNGIVEPGEQCDPPDGVTCDENCQTIFGVPNDNCSDRIVIGDGTTSVNNLGATTDGPPHPECDFVGDDQVGSDVWFTYTASCSGTLTVSLCSTADYDTKIALYGDTNCSDAALASSILACNDDSPGCGLTSEVQATAVAGQSYLIRVGGYAGDQGSGVLSITCSGGICGPGAGDCCNANGSPGCEDIACCEAVCDLDAFCCGTQWDSICAGEAQDNPACPCGVSGLVPAGIDCWDFEGSLPPSMIEIPLLPPAFFGCPASGYDEVVQLCDLIPGFPEMQIRRIDDMVLGDPVVSDTTQIEIVELHLQSCAPIEVQCPGGNSLWDLELDLSDLPSPPGTLFATKEHPAGGTYTANLPVFPKFVFTNVDNNSDVRIFDTGLEGLPPRQYGTPGPVPWVHNPDIPGCGVNFQPGVQEDPGTGDQCCVPACMFAPTGQLCPSANPSCPPCGG